MTSSAQTEHGALLAAARGDDERACGRLVEPHRRELHAHCYRMLGSVHDAEDVPGRQLALEDPRAAPDARYEQRESVELAFVAALQYLPPRPRAVLILREVLGFSAREAAETLDTSVASVNSALQRARAVDERLPEQSQQVTLRALGDRRVRDLVRAYIHAMERSDVDAVVALLTDEPVWSMPPMSTWYRGLEAVTTFLTEPEIFAGFGLPGRVACGAMSLRAFSGLNS